MCGPHQGSGRREGRLATHITQEIPGLVTLAGSLLLPPSAASPPRIQIQSQKQQGQHCTSRLLMHTWDKQQAGPQCVVTIANNITNDMHEA